MKKTVTWVLVADGKRAAIFHNDGPNRGLAPVPGHRYETALPPDRELRSDKPGRTFDSAGGGQRHGISPPTDYHRLEKERFAEGIAEKLETAALANEFDRLVVVAAPQTLGVLRGALRQHATAKLTGTIDKDLTEESAARIAAHLGDLLPV
jgi:protein required for attachment to host cells